MTPTELRTLFALLDELIDRVTRMETRLVKLMLAQGVNPHSGEKME